MAVGYVARFSVMRWTAPRTGPRGPPSFPGSGRDRAARACYRSARVALLSGRLPDPSRRLGLQPAPIDPTPKDKAKTNFTDPEAKIMKQSNKGFDYSYNSQAVVDAAQIIVAAEVTIAANDKEQAVPMAQAALDNLNAAGIKRPKAADGTRTPIPNTADTGYFSKEAVEGLEKLGMDPHLATGRQKHHDEADESEAATPAAEASVKEKMQAKLRAATGKALYAARKQIVEPVFGMIKSARGIRKFLLRGLEKVSAEWQLVCLTHNLLKIWRRHDSVAVNCGG